MQVLSIHKYILYLQQHLTSSLKVSFEIQKQNEKPFLKSLKTLK